MKIKEKLHPVNVFYKICKNYSKENINFNFSIYIYKEKGKTHSRKYIKIPAPDLSSNLLNNILSKLHPEEEFACHSLVDVSGKKRYIPLIDFSVENESLLPWEFINEKKELFDTDFYLFFSGRSYHGYFTTFITYQKWLKFAGDLLLLNQPNSYPTEIIDSRWVGHSIINGFSALRWSSNTNKYLSEPRLTCMIKP